MASQLERERRAAERKLGRKRAEQRRLRAEARDQRVIVTTVSAKPRVVIKETTERVKNFVWTRTVRRESPLYLEVVVDRIYDGLNELVAELELVKIPAGGLIRSRGVESFLVPERIFFSPNDSSEIQEFYFTVKPVSTLDWNAVMYGGKKGRFSADLHNKVKIDEKARRAFFKKLNQVVGNRIYREPNESEYEDARASSSRIGAFRIVRNVD